MIQARQSFTAASCLLRCALSTVQRLWQTFIQTDEVIKKRLLIDGDAGNDEKRLTSLLRTFIRWCNSDEVGEEDSHLVIQRMFATLAQSDHAIQKSAQVYKMNLLEQTNYEKLNKEIEDKIKEAKAKIVECKTELQQAKCVRKHRQEYDMMAKVIQQQPDRQGTIKRLHNQEEEIEQLEKTKESLEQKFDLRKKQFHVLISAIHELQSILDEDNKTEEADDIKDETMDTS